MKRPLSSAATSEDRKMKRVKETETDEKFEKIDGVCEKNRGLASFDENMLFEVLKHVDAKTLAMSSCVNKQWHKTAQDERLWELICTKQWANTGCGEQQLRSVVLALGGFRRLHSLYLLPLSKPQTSSSTSSSCSSSSSASSWGPIPQQVIRSKPLPRLGKDEVHLSLSLLSIRYYEKMNFNNRNM
jgi:F-box protein GID2